MNNNMNEKILIQNLTRDNRALRREVLRLNISKNATNNKIQNKTGMKNKKKIVNVLFNAMLFIFVNITDKSVRYLEVLKINITGLYAAMKFKFSLVIQNFITQIKIFMKPRFKKDSVGEYQELIKRNVMSDIRFKFRDRSAI